jgi:glycosyltransferase involved in cell wall biosynthesis
MRIGVFQYEWPLQVHTLNLLENLVRRGHSVEFFFRSHDHGVSLVDTCGFFEDGRVILHDLSGHKGFFRRLAGRLSRSFARYTIPSPFESVSQVIPPSVVRGVLQRVAESKFDCFIGIEKKGLILSGCIGQLCHIPHLYYNLELYVEDHPELCSFRYMRSLEQLFHRLALATIVQDPQRAQVLHDSNGIEDATVAYLPVSVRAIAHTSRKAGNFLAPNGSKILLYFGLLHPFRMCSELACAASQLPSDCCLVFHGYGDEEYVRSLKASPNVIVSDRLVPETEIPDLIAGSRYGIVLYKSDCFNNRLTAFASEKVALFLRAGKPIIVSSSGNFDQLFCKYKCGICIESVSDLQFAVETIEADYETYSREALLAFADIYDFDKNFDHVADTLNAKFSLEF